MVRAWINDDCGGDDDGGGDGSDFTGGVVGAIDPNEKVGSRGSGSGHYISPEEPLRYSIFYENKETATAPAADIFVEDMLPLAALDLSTIVLGPIALPDRIVTPPTIPLVLGSYVATVDLRPAKPLAVRISATLNTTTGLLRWSFETLDPMTGKPPDDPTLGFLPPGMGGNVSFTVRPKLPVVTNAQITNRASIIFDVPPALVTEPWVNMWDATKPASKVASLPPTQTTSAIQVKWQGTDVGAGIRDYTVYVSDDGAAFVPWLVDVTSTEAAYAGTAGHTYHFYSIAHDLVGNREADKTIPEATTKIVPADTPPPLITPTITGTQGTNGWYTGNVSVTWTVQDTESAISSSTGCSATTLTADTTGVTLTCSATNSAGLSNSASATVKIDMTAPILTGMPAAGACTLSPPDHRLVQVATVGATDGGSGVATLSVVGNSNQPAAGTGPGDLEPDVVIEGTGVAARTVRLRAETAPTGPGRVYTLTGTATDQAGHSASVTGTCTVATGSGSCASAATDQFTITRSGFRLNNATGRFLQTVTITKSSVNVQPLSGPFALVLDAMSSNATLFQSAGTTVCAAPAGSPYILLNAGSTWSTGQSLTVTLEFTNPSRTGITYTPRIVAGGTSR